MSAGLVAWLTKILDEDKADAVKAGGDRWTGDGGIYRGHPTDQVVSYVYGEAEDHIVRHDPAAVLADIAAKRAIIALHAQKRDTPKGGGEPYSYCATCWGETPCPTLRLLAAAYADRPGYLDEWRP